MVAYRFAALAALSSFASAQVYQGFNSGSTFVSGAAKSQQNFHDEFSAASALTGTNGEFNSFRLYTMIQAGTQNTPISAIPAALDTNTNLLLGIWGSAGQANIDNELAALRSAISTYGANFANKVVGISVGSEDLYRISPTGIQNMAGIGAGPAEISSYINQVKNAIRGTPLASKPVGHVDTWTAWVNGTNTPVIQAADFLGVNAFPYYQTQSGDNSIDNGADLFFEAYQNTIGAAEGKPVYITETGWPYSGPTVGQAVASIPNAQRYWNDVACKVLGQTTTFWYTLEDANPANAASFGILGNDLNPTPNIDLSCNRVASSSSSAAPSSTAATSAAASAVASSAAAGASSVASGMSSAAAGVSSAVASRASSVVAGASSVAAGGVVASNVPSAAASSVAAVVSSGAARASSALAGASFAGASSVAGSAAAPPAYQTAQTSAALVPTGAVSSGAAAYSTGAAAPLAPGAPGLYPVSAVSSGAPALSSYIPAPVGTGAASYASGAGSPASSGAAGAGSFGAATSNVVQPTVVAGSGYRSGSPASSGAAGAGPYATATNSGASSTGGAGSGYGSGYGSGNGTSTGRPGSAPSVYMGASDKVSSNSVFGLLAAAAVALLL